jgi:hypothetical protein
LQTLSAAYSAWISYWRFLGPHRSARSATITTFRSDGLLLFASFTEVAQVSGQDVRATRLRFSLDSTKQ